MSKYGLSKVSSPAKTLILQIHDLELHHQNYANCLCMVCT